MIIPFMIIVILLTIAIYLFIRKPKQKIVFPEEISINNFIKTALQILDTRSYLLYRISEKKQKLERYNECQVPDFQLPVNNLSTKEEHFFKKQNWTHIEKVIFRGMRTGYLVIFLSNTSGNHEFKELVESYRPLLEDRLRIEDKVIEANLINEFNIRLGITNDPEVFYRNLVTVSKKILTRGKILPIEIGGTQLVAYLLNKKKVKIPIADLPPEIIQGVIYDQKPLELTQIPDVLRKNLPVQSAKTAFLLPLTSNQKTIGLILYYKKQGSIEPKEKTTLGFICNQATIILDKMVVLRNLNRSIKDIIALQQSAQALLVSSEFEKVIDKILTEASRIIGFQRIILSYYNPAENRLERIGSIGFSKKEWERIKKISPPYYKIKSLLNEEYRISNSYYLRHDAPERSYIEDVLVRRSNPKSSSEELPARFWHPNDILLIPIETGEGEFLGLISADTPIDGLVPDASRLQVFETFATLIGLSFENADAFNHLRGLVDKLQSLHNVTVPISSVGEFEKVLTRILNLTKENFDYHNVAILLKDDANNELFVKVAVGEYLVDPSKVQLKIGRDGVCGMVAEEGKPKLIQNTLNIPFFIGDRNHPRSEIAIPLRSHNKLIGVLNVEKDGINSLDEEDMTLLSILAGHISVAIENALLYEEIGRMSITDELTGVYNYRHLLEVIKYEIERSKRFQHSFSIMMLDIDKFKNFNDQHGHLFGDQILSALAKLLTSSVRASDIVTRYGGDEFVIVLPETIKDQALILAERVRSIVNQHTFKDNIRLTVSIGLASYPIDSQDVFPLIDRVDHMLYISKSKGGNAVSS